MYPSAEKIRFMQIKMSLQKFEELIKNICDEWDISGIGECEEIFHRSMFHNVVSFIVSAVIWGSSIGGILALIQVKACHQVPQKYISAAIGFISAFYAVGQMLGPGLAGWMIEYHGGFASAYCFGALIYFMGLLLTLSLKTENMKVTSTKES